MESASFRPRRDTASRALRGVTASIGVAALVGAGGVLLAAPAPAHAAPPVVTVDFVYSAQSAQTFEVPTGVTSIQYTVTGGHGGKGGGTNGGAGGLADAATGTLSVSAG